METFAKQILNHLGVAVSDIPTSAKEESDFLVEIDSLKVLIEEKTKLDDPAALEERDAVLKSGEVHLSSTPVTKSNRLSGLIKKAASQLASSSELEHDFRVIWFTGVSGDRKAPYFGGWGALP